MGEGRGRLKEREMGGVREREIEWGVMGKREMGQEMERECVHMCLKCVRESEKRVM